MYTKGYGYPKSIILQEVYLKLRFTISYIDVEEIMKMSGVQVDHATIQCWVYKFSPFIEAQMKKRKLRVGTRKFSPKYQAYNPEKFQSSLYL
ncbi:MAG: hypothetical protein V3U92_06560 [Cellulophaga sp.]